MSHYNRTMDRVSETPTKQAQPRQFLGFNALDSDDDLHTDREGVDLLPPPPARQYSPVPSQSSFVTQPTQIIEPRVQVPGSSPLRPSAPPYNPPSQYPASRYPASQHPASQYPSSHHPASQYPASHHPTQYTASQYPASQYTSSIPPHAASAHQHGAAAAAQNGLAGQQFGNHAATSDRPMATPRLASAMTPRGATYRTPHGVQQSPHFAQSRPAQSQRAPYGGYMAPRNTQSEQHGMQAAPAGVQKPLAKPAQSEVIDLSNDEEGSSDGGMPYMGGSDEDTQANARDLKLTKLQPRERPASAFKRDALGGLKGGTNKPTALDSIISSINLPGNPPTQPLKAPSAPAQARPSIAGAKRPADSMASAYGNSSRPAKVQRQAAPIRAQLPDIDVDSISDFVLGQKVLEIRKVYPQTPVREAVNLLSKCHGNVSDALQRIVESMEKKDVPVIDLESEEASSTAAPVPRAPAAKQQLKRPVLNLHDKYAHMAHTAGQPKAQLPSPKKPQSPATPVTPQQPSRKGRLVRGRKVIDDDDDELSELAPPSKARKTSGSFTPSSPTTPASQPLDSGLGSEASESVSMFDGDLLHFFNTCSVGDLCDLACTEKQKAELVLAKRPFRKLSQIRDIEDESNDLTARWTKKKRATRPIGDKIVDQAEKMFEGYEAVDRLVKECKDHGKRITNEMKKWGIDAFGVAKGGEVNLTSLGDSGSKSDNGKSDSTLRDSGIGTPAESDPSVHESPGEKIKKTVNKLKDANLLPQPEMMAEGFVLKDYQVLGMNWLALLYKLRLSCILADDMGLGKTCQVIAFLAHLKEVGVNGPHLIVVPASTLENWLREFQKFCPEGLSVMPYHGSQQEREERKVELLASPPDVIVTTYDMAKKRDDRKFFRKIRPNVCVYDEGHTLKNSKSMAYNELMKIGGKFRLLLTGTPLQNNLGELVSLLGFILPEVFDDCRDELDEIFKHRAKTTEVNHDALLSAQRTERARSMMAPFILRRKKDQVEQHLPKKTREVVKCKLNDTQRAIYEKELAAWKKSRDDRVAGKKADAKAKKITNPMMRLRQAAIHPYLARQHYTDKLAREIRDVNCAAHPEDNPEDILDLLTVDVNDVEIHEKCLGVDVLGKYALPDDPYLHSGKVTALVELLARYKAASDRVLIFSQFTKVMDILERVLDVHDVPFFRLDGDTPVNERQDLIDEFYARPEVTAFMLSTRSGGAGINLAAANKVVIFDPSFNPQDDVQAENRAHRMGQTRPVEVVRLISEGTIEEQIHALGRSKMALDERVSGGVDDGAAEVGDAQGQQRVEEMVLAAEEKEAAPKA